MVVPKFTVIEEKDLIFENSNITLIFGWGIKRIIFMLFNISFNALLNSLCWVYMHDIYDLFWQKSFKGNFNKVPILKLKNFEPPL